MPSLKNKKNDEKVKKHKLNADSTSLRGDRLGEGETRRRPSDREEQSLVEVSPVKVIKVQEVRESSPDINEAFESTQPIQESLDLSENFSESQDVVGQGGNSFSSDSVSNEENEKINLKFPGDQWVKKSFPKTFELSENLVNDWVQNGEFENLPIQNPFVRYAAKTGLKKAKSIETQVLESPVTEKIVTKVFEIGLKAQMRVDEFREKIKK